MTDSLPPADVQRPTPPLTDEELAAEEAAHVRSAWGPCLRCERFWPCPPLLLIANLRATRAELAVQRQDAREDYARAEEAEAEVVKLRGDVAKLRAEVERLRSWMGRDARNAYDGSDDPLRGQ